jgi:hypothetical protein
LELTDLERIDLGVVSGEGIGFYEKLEFEHVEEVVIEGTVKHLMDEKIWVGVRAVCGRKEK